MSEEARLTYLQERIREARRREKEANWMAAGGILVAALGWFIYGYLLETYGVLILILGISVVIACFTRASRSRKQYTNLLYELEKVALKPPQHACILYGALRLAVLLTDELFPEQHDWVTSLQHLSKSIDGNPNIPEKVKQHFTKLIENQAKDNANQTRACMLEETPPLEVYA